MALAIGLITHVENTLAASAPSSAAAEKTPLHLDAPSSGKSALSGSSGGGLLRTVIGLVVVVLVIWAISKVLRYIKASKESKASGNGLQSVATLPLGNNRAVHVVRVGSEILLLGTAEQQVTQLARYSEDEALARGLIEVRSGGGSAVVNVTPREASQVAVTRNGLPVQAAGAPRTIGSVLDQLRQRTVRM